MKLKFLTFFTALIALFAFGTFVSAQDGAQDAPQAKGEHRKGGFGGGHHRGGGKNFLSALNLTEAQQTQARAIFENQKTANQALHDELRQLKSQKQNGELSTEQQTRVQELRSQMKAAHEKSQADLIAILTPEQRTQFEQKRGEMREGRGGGGGKRHRGDFGTGMMRGMSRLNLTAEQQQQARTIFETSASSTKALREELNQIQQQKRGGATLTAGQETRAKELRSQLRHAMQKAQADFKAILTPEQQTQIEQKRGGMRQRRQNQQNAPIQ